MMILEPRLIAEVAEEKASGLLENATQPTLEER
jgi:hypothetical protein